MFKLIKEGELKFPEKPKIAKEGEDFIRLVINFNKKYLKKIKCL